jgi:hypothetical protein
MRLTVVGVDPTMLTPRASELGFWAISRDERTIPPLRDKVSHLSSQVLEGTLRYREVEDEVKGTTFKHRIAEVHANSIKRLSKIEAADDPSDGAGDE